MSFPHLPIEGLHEFNLDYVLSELKRMGLEWDEVKEEWDLTRVDWEEMKDFITKFFEELDLQEEVNIKLEDMKDTGELSLLLSRIVSNITAPIFVSTIEEMINKSRVYVLTSTGNIYTYSESSDSFFNTGLLYGLNDYPVSASNVYVTDRNITDFNNFDTSFQKNKIYAISGDVISQIENRPLLPYNGNALLINMAYNNTSDGGRIQILKSYQDKGFMFIRTKWADAWGAWENVTSEIKVLTSANTDYTTADDFPNNSVLFISSNVTAENIANLPHYGFNAIVHTITTISDVGALQLYYSNRFVNLRIKWVNTWDNWRVINISGEVITDDNLSSFNDVNNYQGSTMHNIPARYYHTDISNLPEERMQQVITTFSNDPKVPTDNSPMGIQISIGNEGATFIRQKYMSSWLNWYRISFTGKQFGIITSSSRAPYDDANTFPTGTILGANCAPEVIANLPVYRTPTIIITFGVDPSSELARHQLCFDINQGIYYHRESWGGSKIWKPWVSSNDYYVNTVVRATNRLNSNSVLAVFGDSLSATTGGGTRIGTQIANMFSCQVFEYGVPGAAFSTDETNSIIAQVNSAEPSTPPTHILVFGATNDAGLSKDIEMFKTSVTTTINTIQTKFPNAQITYITPFNGGVRNFYGVTYYAGIATSICVGLDCDIISCLNNPLTPNTNVPNISCYYADRTHPNATGKKIMANFISQYFK